MSRLLSPLFCKCSDFSRHLRISAVCSLLLALSASAFAFASREDKLPPQYRDWLTRDVVYIITAEEREAFLQLASDKDRDNFIERFWEIRNPNPGSPTNEYKQEIYRRIAYANQYFGHESGTPGWRTDMGRTYITLGAPQQRAPYVGQANVRPMEIWFYSSPHPALPPFFYVVFYQREAGGDFRFYSPYLDGPGKLVSSASVEGSRQAALTVIDKDLGREVARTTLSLLPDEPVDMQGASSSLQSDVMLATIRNLANNPQNKRMLAERRNLLEQVSHRLVLGSEFLDLLAVPLRDREGAWNLHYVLRFKRPQDFTIAQDNSGRFYYAAEVSARVSDANGKLIFEQRRKLSDYVDPAKLEAVKNKVFGYEGLLPLAPGKYKVDFALSNEMQKTTYREQRDIAVPSSTGEGLLVSDVVPFSDAESAKAELAPFTVAGVKFSPLIGQGISLVPGQDLKFFYQIWGPAVDPQSYGDAKLTAEYAYGRMGMHDTKTLQEQFAKAQFDRAGAMVNGKKIPTTDLGPGNYRLTVTINDPSTRQKTFAGFQFRIADTDPSSAAWTVSDPQLDSDLRSGLIDFQRGLALQAQGDKQSAANSFAAAFQKNPKDENFRAKLVDVYYADKQFARIAELYARTGITEKTDEETILRIAESLEKSGDLGKTIQLLESAVTSRPASGPLYLALSGCYQRAGNPARAADAERKGKNLMTARQPTS